EVFEFSFLKVDLKRFAAQSFQIRRRIQEVSRPPSSTVSTRCCCAPATAFVALDRRRTRLVTEAAPTWADAVGPPSIAPLHETTPQVGGCGGSRYREHGGCLREPPEPVGC